MHKRISFVVSIPNEQERMSIDVQIRMNFKKSFCWC